MPDAKAQLICFPHAGGSATYYRGLSESMASSPVQLVSIQYPGRQDRHREPLIDSISELADCVADVVDSSKTMPTAFFGHSMGATLAFEVARRWERRRAPASALFVSARRAPSVLPPKKVPLDSDVDIMRELHKLGGTDLHIFEDADTRRMLLPVIRNDYRASEFYRYQPGLDVSCPIFALFGDRDPRASRDEIEAWSEHTSESFEARAFPGGHFFFGLPPSRSRGNGYRPPIPSGYPEVKADYFLGTLVTIR
ncbi:thioesterase II family protein [Rhodococcus sp. BS-15]|uniref:thioesterase II family protein n=1 Tax=Rhodococcus sp. BS-15 TaxID=1304954 RepID=UPI0035B52C55